MEEVADIASPTSDDDEPRAPKPGSITALVLAGQRPGTDPLAAAHGIDRKALVRVGGRPMVSQVLETLTQHKHVGRILVAAQDSAALANDPAMASWLAEDRVEFCEAGGTIAATLSRLLGEGRIGRTLVTTADNILLTPAMIDHFLGEASQRDLGIAMVERQTLLDAYPDARRSWVRFRGGAWSGANLFWIGGSQVQPLIDIWRDVEQDRKKGWRVLSAFGPGLLLAAVLRLTTLQGGIARVGARHGIDAALIPMPQPEACIDVDKPDDVALAETILAGRQAAASA